MIRAALLLLAAGMAWASATTDPTTVQEANYANVTRYPVVILYGRSGTGTGSTAPVVPVAVDLSGRLRVVSEGATVYGAVTVTNTVEVAPKSSATFLVSVGGNVNGAGKILEVSATKYWISSGGTGLVPQSGWALMTLNPSVRIGSAGMSNTDYVTVIGAHSHDGIGLPLRTNPIDDPTADAFDALVTYSVSAAIVNGAGGIVAQPINGTPFADGNVGLFVTGDPASLLTVGLFPTASVGIDSSRNIVQAGLLPSASVGIDPNRNLVSLTNTEVGVRQQSTPWTVSLTGQPPVTVWVTNTNTGVTLLRGITSDISSTLVLVGATGATITIPATTSWYRLAASIDNTGTVLVHTSFVGMDYAAADIGQCFGWEVYGKAGNSFSVSIPVIESPPLMYLDAAKTMYLQTNGGPVEVHFTWQTMK